MTELQFLIDLLLNQKLSPATKKLVGDRIGFVEEALRANKYAQPMQIQRPLSTTQAASTQALLEKHELMPTAPLPLAIPATQRIIGGEVNTGNGTKGPRKF